MTTLILVCLAYNPVAPEDYLIAMEKANAVQTVIESTLVLQEPKEVKKVSTKKQIKSKGYTHTELWKRIIKCESNWNVYASNKTSSARWLAQFLTKDFQRKDWSRHLSTWTSSSMRYLGYKWDVFNEEEHLTVFYAKLKNEWTSAWNASKHCWWK